MERAFATIRRVANLSLKANKCSLFSPVFEEVTALTIFDVQEWMAQFIPAWADFSITASLKYLGFWLGTTAGSLVWNEPMMKWKRTTRMIGDSARSPAVAAIGYKTRAVTTLGYVGQLAAAPDNFAKDDALAAARIPGMPPQAVRRSDLFRMCEYGGPRVSSAEVLLAATRSRAAATTLSTWKAACKLVRTVNGELRDLGAILEQIFAKRADSCFCCALSGCVIDWAAVSVALGRAAPYVAMAVIKTLSNGWTTSVRMHELVPLPCVLGCAPSRRVLATRQFNDDGRDDAGHYLTCPRLWRMFVPNLADESWDPAFQMGLQPISGQRLRNVARVHFAYHQLKFSAQDSPSEERITAAKRLAFIAVPVPAATRVALIVQ